MSRKDKNWVQPDILEHMRANNAATIADLRSIFPFYADGTLRTQRIRALQELGLKKKPVHRNKKKKKIKRDFKADEQTFQNSLDAMANIPHTAFVPHAEAGTMANGAKRHVNTMTARQELSDKAAVLADEWVSWMKSVDDIPKSDNVDFNSWINSAPKHVQYRKEKLLKRWEKLQIIVAVLGDAIAGIYDGVSTAIDTDQAQNIQACNLVPQSSQTPLEETLPVEVEACQIQPAPVLAPESSASDT